VVCGLGFNVWGLRVEFRVKNVGFADSDFVTRDYDFGVGVHGSRFRAQGFVFVC
jgi:hypothetical protein